MPANERDVPNQSLLTVFLADRVEPERRRLRHPRTVGVVDEARSLRAAAALPLPPTSLPSRHDDHIAHDHVAVRCNDGMADARR